MPKFVRPPVILLLNGIDFAPRCKDIQVTVEQDAIGGFTLPQRMAKIVMVQDSYFDPWELPSGLFEVEFDAPLDRMKMQGRLEHFQTEVDRQGNIRTLVTVIGSLPEVTIQDYAHVDFLLAPPEAGLKMPEVLYPGAGLFVLSPEDGIEEIDLSLELEKGER